MPSLEYEDTDAEVAEVAQLAIEYIYHGDPGNIPYDLRGLCVFGVIQALRVSEESDPLFFEDPEGERQGRIAEIEDIVDLAVAAKMHYYPFGHIDDTKFAVDYEGDRDAKQRANTTSGRGFARPTTLDGRHRFNRRRN